MVERPLDAQDGQDDEDERDPQLVAGRRASVAAGAGAPLAPGPGAPPGVVPRASIDAAEPGRDRRFVDVEQVDREVDRRERVVRRRRARGCPAAAPAPADAPAEADGAARALGAAPLPALADGSAAASGSGIGVTVYTPSWSVPANVTAAPPLVPATSGVAVPSGAVTVSPTAPLGMTSSTGVPGSTASVGAVVAPSSSPVRLASRIGNATWSGRSERRGSKARTALGSPSRMPGVQQRRAARSGDDRARPVGRGQPRGLRDVRGRKVDEAQHRLVGVERRDARVRQLPVTWPRSLVRGGAIARTGECGSVAGRKPSKITRSHGRPSVRWVAGP